LGISLKLKSKICLEVSKLLHRPCIVTQQLLAFKSLRLLLLLPISLASAFDLSSAYQSALEYNSDYLASIAKNKAGQENVVQGRSQLLPQISALGSFGENYLNSESASMYYNQPTVSAQLQQVVYDFSKFSQYTKSKFATQLSDLELTRAQQKLILEVSEAYFDVLYAIDTLDTIDATEKSFQQQFTQANKAFNAGIVTITDVNDAKSSLDSASADRIKAQNNLINKKNILHNLTGLDVEQIQPIISDILLVNPLPNEVKSWINNGEANNINIKIANVQMQMARADVKIAYAGHLPSFYFSGGYQNVGNANINSANQQADQTLVGESAVPGMIGSSYVTASAAVTVNIPIYSGGLVSSQVRQAKSNFLRAQNQLLSVERETEQNIKNEFFAMQNGVNIVKARAQAMKSAALKLKSDQLGYKVGVRNSVDLIGAQKNYYKSIQDYNQARYQYLLDSLNLHYMAGSINTQVLSQINKNIAIVANGKM
jgi:outer membrane protein